MPRIAQVQEEQAQSSGNVRIPNLTTSLPGLDKVDEEDNAQQSTELQAS